MIYRYTYQLIQALDEKIGPDQRRIVESQPIPEPAARVPTPDPDMPDIPFNLFD